MKKIFAKFWDKINEPHIEKLLIVFVPFLTLVAVGLILAPNLLYLMSGATAPGISPSASPAGVQKDEGYAHAAMDAALPSASPAPLISPEPLETPQLNENGSLGGWQDIAGASYYYDENGVPLTGLQLINGKLYFFDQYGVKSKALGIDVSFYNGFINWPAVAAQGIDFAIIRAGGRGWETGLIYDDDWFQRNLMEARLAGIDLGVYFFSTARAPMEAQQEADYVIRCLGGSALELPVFIDVEYSGDYPRGRADTLTNTEREVIIDVFCRTVMDAGYEAGVYSGEYYYKYNLDYRSLSKYTLWLASYTRGARLPDFPVGYDIWQFTESGIVNGITGIVDMNAVF